MRFRKGRSTTTSAGPGARAQADRPVGTPESGGVGPGRKGTSDPAATARAGRARPLGAVGGGSGGAATAALGRFLRRFVPTVTRRRVILVVVVVAVATWFLYGDQVSIDAQGVVVGNTTALSSLRRGRMVYADVPCNTPVQAGDPLFGFEHEPERTGGFGNLNILEERLARARVDVDRARLSLRTAEQRVRVAEQEAAAMRDRVGVLEDLVAAGAITRFDWQDARSRLDALEATIDLRAAEVADQRAGLELARRLAVLEAQHLDAERTAVADQEIQDRFSQILAPVSGVLVSCTVKPGEVAEAGTPVAELFVPEQAYVLAFFEPTQANRLIVGTPATVEIVGVGETLPARIGPREIDMRELPENLQRFFWEAPQWSQFQPVQVWLEPDRSADMANLRQGARARINVSLSDPFAWIEEQWNEIWPWNDTADGGS